MITHLLQHWEMEDKPTRLEIQDHNKQDHQGMLLHPTLKEAPQNYIGTSSASAWKWGRCVFIWNRRVEMLPFGWQEGWEWALLYVRLMTANERERPTAYTCWTFCKCFSQQPTWCYGSVEAQYTLHDKELFLFTSNLAQTFIFRKISASVYLKLWKVCFI